MAAPRDLLKHLVLLLAGTGVGASLSYPEVGLAQQSFEPAPELAAFAFLIGDWQAEVRVHMADGTVARQTATWTATYILAGHAIYEEYRAIDEEGQVAVFGANLRAYDAENERWIMYWYDALSSTLTHLGPPELGGVTVTQESISFKFRMGDALTRAGFEDMTHDRFTWHGDVSLDDGETWQEDTIIVEATRVRD